MIILNKTEAKKVREHFGDVALVRTCKGKSKRGHYYCEERKDVMAFVERMRELDVEHTMYGKYEDGRVYYYTLIPRASQRKIDKIYQQTPCRQIGRINDKTYSLRGTSIVTQEMLDEALDMLNVYNMENEMKP